MYHASLQEAGKCGTFFLYLAAEQFADMSFYLRLSAIQAFAKISDDYRDKLANRGVLLKGVLLDIK